MLKVRWSLIQKGHLRKSIKINSQRCCIYVNNQLFGKVVNSQFQQLTSVQPILENPSSVQSQQASISDKRLITLESPDHSIPTQQTLISNQLLKCFYINIRSIVNKFTQFQSLVYSHKYDLIAITETWLTENMFDSEILPNQYIIYHNDR